MKQFQIIALLALSCLGSGCILFAGAGLGYVITQRALDDGSLEARVHYDVEQVWLVVRESMQIQIEPATELTLYKKPRRAIGNIDLEQFEVEVQAFDHGDTVILVKSRGAPEGRRKLMDYILRRLSKAKSSGAKPTSFSQQPRASAG